jgi:hypothetical protein
MQQSAQQQSYLQYTNEQLKRAYSEATKFSAKVYRQMQADDSDEEQPKQQPGARLDSSQECLLMPPPAAEMLYEPPQPEQREGKTYTLEQVDALLKLQREKYEKNPNEMN